MTETEKITINIGAVDLGKVDLLVQEGFYSNRSDFIRTAIRILINAHEEEVKESMTRRSLAIGLIHYSKESLEIKRTEGVMLDIKAIGTVVIASDIPADLAMATINKIQVYGILRASQEVKDALADRIL
jgi:Arc/MetJ-type ribon-helix-helix transcriptional regulator